MTKVKINGTELKISQREPLLAGSVGLNRIRLEFSPEWSGLTRQIDFTNEQSGDARRISAQDSECTVPWELLRAEGDISCYVRGIGADGKLKLRTNDANLGTVLGEASESVPGTGTPTPDVYDELAANVGDLETLDTREKSQLVGAINEVNKAKQDKLIAGENITIAADGKTVSAAAVGCFEVTITEQSDGTYTADKTYEQVKSEIENNKRILLVPGEKSFFELRQVTEDTMKFTSFDPRDVACKVLTVREGDVWTVEKVMNPNTESILELFGDVGVLGNLRTEYKTHLVGAINELKRASDTKADAADLSKVATSGSYNDLADKPTIPTVPTDAINANTSARHTHSNKTALDSITAASRNKWNVAYNWVDTNKDGISSHISNTVVHIRATERTEWNAKQDKLVAGENITIAADGKTISATGGLGLKIVDSVDEMVDTTKQYVLSTNGHIYEYKTTQTTGTVTEQIGYAEGDANTDNTRLGSDGTTYTGYSGYVVTPFIDLLKYPVPFTLHLNGGTFIPTASDSYTRIASYTADKAKIACVNTVSNQIDTVLNVSDADVSASAGNAGSITFNQTPKTNNANNDGVLKYVRFSGKSTIADINVYVTYTGTTTTQGWTDTGVAYGGNSAELANKVAAMNNEGADATAFQLLPPVVQEYYNKPAYSDSDYSTTHIVNYGHDAARPYRGDIPQPVMIKWPHNENAVRTTVTVDGQTLDATGRDRLPVYNLIPATQYAYKVTHILADGTIVTAKSGSFTTAAQTVRLLYVDGCQNFRDLGGWSAENGKKVKYGQLIRGAAVDESTYPHLLITDKGRHELIDHIGVKAECDLRWQMTESGISKDLPFLCSGGIGNYASTITTADLRTAVKAHFEWILARLQESKPVYFHCQGGCDRTGTLSFLLLGVLGVSESDLARDYELSCFSPLGTGRVRNATLYNYSGMVTAVKAYSGDTLQAKITDYLTTGCAISAESITAFKNLMLE